MISFMVVAKLHNICMFTHPADICVPGHVVNVSSIFSILIALFLYQAAPEEKNATL